ncbi:CPCC family cysteine-rich protein [Dyadobacter luteus]|nr:CPCC family cysteine-rich protein [Dyadobacter luteus]
MDKIQQVEDQQEICKTSQSMYTCPCCGYKSLAEKASESIYEICPVCFWETDPVQNDNPEYEGGTNSVSLKAGQRNFLVFGACDKKKINQTRSPLKDELKDPTWKPFD